MNAADLSWFAGLEWANYAATEPLIKATPASTLIMREDVIITSARLFRTSDANHACLLRATPETVDALISEATDHFKSRRLPVSVFVSPACTPPDLEERLLAHGFQKQEGEEAWIVIRDLPNWQPPAPSPEVQVREIGKGGAWAFARVYLAAFGMSVLLTPFTALLLRRSIGLPNVHYYVATMDGKPVGTALWYSHEDIACLGGTGVLPAQRGSKVATSLGVKAIGDAQRLGFSSMLSQTLHPRLERFMIGHGFERVFVRSCYTR